MSAVRHLIYVQVERGEVRLMMAGGLDTVERPRVLWTMDADALDTFIDSLMDAHSRAFPQGRPVCDRVEARAA